MLDFLEGLPFASFTRRSPVSNKEAQVLYDVWTKGETDEYGRLIVDSEIDPIQIASLTSKGYVRNHASRFATRDATVRTLEFTDKGKEIIKKIILHTEQSSFDKSSSNNINFEAICTASDVDKILDSTQKTASKKRRISNSSNWFQRIANTM